MTAPVALMLAFAPTTASVCSLTSSDVWAMAAPMKPPAVALAEAYEVRSEELVSVKSVALMLDAEFEVTPYWPPTKASVSAS